jgi:GH24 family phage-related lysozyme (muramidase)
MLDDQDVDSVSGPVTTFPSDALGLGPTGEAFLKHHEGWHGFGTESVEHGSQTAFWGHKVQPGEDLSQMDADNTFQADRARAEGLVRGTTDGVQLTQPQFDGLVSFAYNSPKAFHPAPDNFFYNLLSEGNIRGAANRMLLYDKADNGMGGKIVVPGLANRRNAERNLILDGNYGDAGNP